jgi:ribosome-binding factor A
MKERKKFEVIRKISEIINKLNPEKNVLLTVIDVSLPKKGGVIKIYLSVFPEEKTKEIINYLNKKQRTIKNKIIENVYLRHLPSKVLLYASFEFKKAQKVLELINEVTKQEKWAED